MNDETEAHILRAAAAAVRAVAKRVAPEPWAADEDEAVARYRGRRRCDQPGRDQMVYRLGAAIEAAGGLDMPDDALLGFLIAPEGFAWLVEESFRRAICGDGPDTIGRLLDMMRAVLEDPPRRRFLLGMGVWTRFQRDQAFYRANVEAFAKSKAAEGRRWRSRQPTDPQRYLIERIVRAHEVLGEPIESPLPCSRGEAYDWIRAHGGNPRFWNQPEPPAEPPMAGPSDNGDLT